MYDSGDYKRSIRIANHREDIPTEISGVLFPSTYYRQGEKVRVVTGSKNGISIWQLRVYTLVPIALLIFVFAFGPLAYLIPKGDISVAAPVVFVNVSGQTEPEPLHYGVQAHLSQPNFFAETRNSFVQNGLSFIEADLSEMRIAYYENGEEVFFAPILSKGKEGSWWETPAGLYDIELKEKNHFSSFGHVYQPWSMSFQGNFFIHGWPKYPDGSAVPEGYSGGCIRLSDEDAEALYELSSVGVPVLVFEKDFEGDSFVYEPNVPELETTHYLLADIQNNAILASSDLDEVAPIASLAKLMTALVAAEYINLDTSVYVSQEKYVSTLIPRLSGKQKVSMYSLLQLLLVESSNEAAEVIASQVGRDRFITLMNEKAASLGLAHTVFADPSGLDDGNVSTISDLLRLTQYIYNNRSFILELTSNQDLPTAYVSGEFGTLDNFNQIKDVDNFIGGKVGETLAAGQTSVSLHRINIDGENRILGIVLLGSKDRSADVVQLLDYVKERFVK